MRISDWSSDVCSSDLASRCASLTTVLALPARCAVERTPDVTSLVAAAVFSSAAACCSVRRDRSSAAELISLEPVLMLSADPATESMIRSEEHTSELQSLMRLSYAVFCLNKQKE